MHGVLHEAAPGNGNRLICYCSDCQSFAHFLGHADDLLDGVGGTDIFQTSPAHLEFTRGSDRLACIRLRPRGLMRWYASCCHTPICNTPANGNLPFMGMILPMWAGIERGSPNANLGPVRVRVYCRSATGPVTGPNTYDVGPLSFMLRMSTMLLAGRMRGDHKRSPLFDPETRTPRVSPRVLTAEQLEATERARDLHR